MIGAEFSVVSRRRFLARSAACAGGLLAGGLPTAFAAPADARRAFTVAVLPDTQYYSQKFPHVFTAQTRWLRDNARKLNLAFVAHVGDIVQDNLPKEWRRADTSLSLLDGVVPYGLNVGNHDFEAIFEGNKFIRLDRDQCRIDQYFPVKRYASQPWWGGAWRGSNHNSYQVFSAAGMDFLVLNLEFGPRNEVLEWAHEVIRKHPDRRVWLVTHAYMFNDDTRIGEGDNGGPKGYRLAGNDGDETWEKFVRRHKQMFLVTSGHICVAKGTWKHDPAWTETGLQTSVGDHGNKVHEILADYQSRENGGNGFLRLMRFTPDQNQIDVTTYSPFLDQHLVQPHNQFQLPYAMG